MRVLVTGGAGFIGHHLVHRLLEDPAASVRVLDNLQRGRHTFGGTPRVEFVQGDIRDRKAVRAAMGGIDLVYHLAAQSNVLGAGQDLEYSFTTNVAGTFEVLQAAQEGGAGRVIFASSREVYGEAASLPVVESAPLNPKNSYGASKAAGELYCRVFAADGLSVAVLRLANVYGPGDFGRVIPLFLDNAIHGRPLVIYGGDHKLLDFVWIGDVVRALVKVQTASLDGQPVNIGSGEGTTLRDLAQRILRLTGSSAPIECAAHREAETDRFVPDIRLAERLLDYHPAPSLAHLAEVAVVAGGQSR